MKAMVLFLIIYLCIQEAASVETYHVPSVGNCEKCPPGTYWKENCKENNGKSTCMPCPPETFNSVYSQAHHCEHCLICPIGTAEKIPCTSTTDSVCECPTGMYWKHFTGGEGKCMAHSVCQPDQKTITAVCECPTGKYWKHIIGGEGKCIVHSVCQTDQKIINAGTATENTQCGPLDEQVTTRKTTEPVGGHDVDHGDSGSCCNRSNIMILFVVPVVLVYFLDGFTT